ncbi:tRNA pseudouridine(55) synthase TruB [Halobacteriovorax sp. HLS]|uniref:tRNA pseudouridine synthase B n=1 Tax=Halobacteriovorax sp. HLS TaxID=2234000 RepID=UPI000FDBCE13|nr:tRNA pseudouridine(55) synthase TruB [Halobacteriovorax sp. HLS]
MSRSRNRNKYNEGPLFGPLVFNVYKPVGMTSSDVVRHFKYHLPKGFGKIGHFGTLDPFAEGVLLIAIGLGPRFNDYVHAHYPKTYIATGVLGVESPTGDFTGDQEQVVHHEVRTYSQEELGSIISSFKGKYMQSPAAFSATKHEGKSLYEWAREGVIIEKPPVEREIYNIKLLSVVDNIVRFEVTASSGTYIRVLFDDIAQKLGTRGTLKELVRSSIGPARCENALNKDNWPLRDTEFEIFEKSTSIDDFLDFDKISLDLDEGVKFTNGMVLRKEKTNGLYWVYHNDKLLGLCEVEDELLRVRVGLSVKLV